MYSKKHGCWKGVISWTRCRIAGEQPIECFVRVILFHLNTRSALQRTVASLVLSAWEKKPLEIGIGNGSTDPSSQNGSSTVTSTTGTSACHPGLEKRLLECLTEPIYFDEVAYGYTKLQSECRDFIATLKHYKVPPCPEWDFPGLFSFDQIQKLSGESFEEMIQKHVKKSKIQESLLERRKCIWNLYVHTKEEFTSLSTMWVHVIIQVFLLLVHVLGVGEMESS